MVFVNSEDFPVEFPAFFKRLYSQFTLIYEFSLLFLAHIQIWKENHPLNLNFFLRLLAS